MRQRVNFVGGIVEDDPLGLSATTMTSQALAALPVVEEPDFLALILDPDGLNGEPEIVWVVEHEELAQTATIEREKEGSTAREHNSDTYWVHAPTAHDWNYIVVNTDNPSQPGRIFVGSTPPIDAGYPGEDGDVWIYVAPNG